MVMVIQIQVKGCLKDIQFFINWPDPCKMKLEVNFKISKNEVKPVFIGFCTSHIFENKRYFASVLGFYCFLGYREQDFA